jgi:hypothetical protein
VEFVNHLNSAYVYNSGGVKRFFFCLCCTGCSENSEMKIVFIILLRGSTTKVDDLGVEFLS